MRLVVVSDTHTYHNRIAIPDGDVFIHCGDATFRGDVAELGAFDNWLATLPHKHKLFVPGNHDLALQYNPGLIQNATVLIDQEITIDGVKFYGFPWVPTYGNWAFMLDDESDEFLDKAQQIPKDTQILISHGPPTSIRDWNNRGGHCGSETLFHQLAELTNLKYHFFGHIHEAHGSDSLRNIQFVNASICNYRYEPINPVTVVDYVQN